VSLHSVDLALAFFPRVIGVKSGTAAFDRAPDKISDGMLEDLYAGTVRANQANEVISESARPIAWPSIS
jgi:phosphonate transport system ATP-binding protein